MEFQVSYVYKHEEDQGYEWAKPSTAIHYLYMWPKLHINQAGTIPCNSHLEAEDKSHKDHVQIHPELVDWVF